MPRDQGVSAPPSEGSLQVDKTCLQQRKTQFLQARVSKQSELRKHQIAAEFDPFIHAISGAARNWTQATYQDVVDWLCFLDTQGDGTTVVHVPTCTEFDSKTWGGCARTLGCAKRYAAGSLDKGYIVKLRAAYSELLGRGTEWSPLDQSGNPASGVCVTQHLAVSYEEQKSGISPKQAPMLLRTDLHALLISMRARLAGEALASQRIMLVRDIALFAVVFHTGRREDDLHHTLGSGVPKLPNHDGFILNFPFGKNAPERRNAGGSDSPGYCITCDLPSSGPLDVF